MNLINLTPHTITIVCENQNQRVRTLPSKGCARCTFEREMCNSVDGIPVNRITVGEITGLPEEKLGTMYIVSRIVAEAVGNKRKDILMVDETIRNEEGAIIGCKSLSCI